MPNNEEQTKENTTHARNSPSTNKSGIKSKVFTKKSIGQKKPMIALAAVVLIAAVILGARYWAFSSSHVSTDNAQLTSDVVQIAPQVSGNVARVVVKDNQVVKAGDLLVVLDDSTFQAGVDQAKANLDAAVAQARGAGVNVALITETGSAQTEQAQGAVDLAKSGITGARADVERSSAAVDTAIAGLNAAQSGVTVAIANKQRYSDSIGSSQASLDTAEAGLHAAQATVGVCQANYDKASHDARRYTSLLAKGAVSEQTADQATMNANAAQAQLENSRQGVESAKAVIAQRKADLSAARQQLNAADASVQQAKAQSAAALTGVAQARAQKKSVQQSILQAQARHQQATGQLALANTAPRQVAVSRSAQEQAKAKVEQAQAALKAAKLQLGYTHIYAPVSGLVSKKVVEVGSLVQPGTPLMAVIPNHSIWVVANFKETQLAHMHPGESAEIEVDGMPGLKFHGRVDSISAATGATFALLPPDNATGNFVKVVQRIPVKILLDDDQPNSERLIAGMSVTAVIKVR